MAYPRRFLSVKNFELAFVRIVRSSHKDYKRFYRHLFPSYSLALRENLEDLIDDIRTGRYSPSKPTVIYQPKKSLILRPITLLSLRDLIVYQAVVNYVAEKHEHEQAKLAFKRRFGAMFAGRDSAFFFRSWKVGYQRYNKVIKKHFDEGLDYVADFDLVSFYELIDHKLLRGSIEKRVNSPEVLDLLFRCLESWTTDAAGCNVRHGVPQGPEPSAFLAECLLFHIDDKKYKGVKYLRYIDDIKLMADTPVPVRRALLQLDLASKELGLVPQAQKIEFRRVKSVDELLKTIPSAIADTGDGEAEAPSKRDLYREFRASIKKTGKDWEIIDITKFKFTLVRLNPRLDVLKRVAPFLTRRPDLAYVLSIYLKKFEKNRTAASALRDALISDPTYDAAAGAYIDALDVCEPAGRTLEFRRAVQTAKRRSEEKSILLDIAVGTFRGRRMGAADALRMIEEQQSPIVRGVLTHRLFGDSEIAQFKVDKCYCLLEAESRGQDGELAQYAAALRLGEWPWFVAGAWKPGRDVHRSVKLLMVGLGLRSRAPGKKGVLEAFFQGRMGIAMNMPWRKALGRDLRDAERRCLRLQQLLVGDPTARIMILDTFNEALIQRFSRIHPKLAVSYAKAAGKQIHPDFGAWVNQPDLPSVLTKWAAWYRGVHDARVKSDLAHAKVKGGKGKGAATRPITYDQAEKLFKHAQPAWAELIAEWKKIL